MAQGADERLAERAAEEARRLGEREEPAVRPQQAIETVLAAFPGSEVLEDLEQIGHDRWADRRTGLIQDGTPAGAVPLISG